MTRQLALPTIGVAQPLEPEWASDARVVLNLLRRDADGWSRYELESETGMHDRRVRDAVTALRRLGWPVVSNSGQAGYRLATNAEDVAHTVAEYRHRAHELLETAAKLEQAGYLLGSAA